MDRVQGLIKIFSHVLFLQISVKIMLDCWTMQELILLNIGSQCDTRPLLTPLEISPKMISGHLTINTDIVLGIGVLVNAKPLTQRAELKLGPGI